MRSSREENKSDAASDKDRSSDAEVASLLDSCESEDEDCASIAACGSEDYSQYIDETGRLNDEDDMKAAAAITNAALIRESTKSPPRPDGLAFDLNQPWERSLLRQLEQQTENEEPRPRRELMLLGHTESRDFAMEFDQDDAVSLDTNASSTVPTKAQIIHRTFLNPQPRVVYHISDEEHERIYGVKQNAMLVMDRRKGRDSAASSLTDVTLQTEDDRDEISFPAKKIPDQLPGRRRRPDTQHFLEMEASVNDEETSYTQEGAVTVATTGLPDPGCFCMGYNMLDYVLPPPTNVYSAKNQRLGLRTKQLSRVEEDTAALPEIIDLTDIKATTYRSPKNEPEGSYSPARNHYSAQKRQSVEL